MRRRRNILLIPLAVLLLTAALAWWPATSDRSAGGGGHVLSQLLDGLMAPHAAHARRVISPTRGFGDTLVLRDDRRLIEASGTFACSAEDNARWRVDVTIEQGDAHAAGHTQGHCGGRLATWQLVAVARGRVGFEPGPASGCGVLLVIVRGTVTDSASWCDDFKLVSRG